MHSEQSNCKAFISETRLLQVQVGSQRWRLSELSDPAHHTYGYLIEMGQSAGRREPCQAKTRIYSMKRSSCTVILSIPRRQLLGCHTLCIKLLWTKLKLPLAEFCLLYQELTFVIKETICALREEIGQLQEVFQIPSAVWRILFQGRNCTKVSLEGKNAI